MKTCCRCKRSLPPSAFHKNRTQKDGLQRTCKECKAGAWDPEKHRLARERYAKKHPERVKAAWTRSSKKHPKKLAARRAVTYAVKTGKLVKRPCEGCGNPLAQAHHEDYEKKLDVRWLCSECHGKEHRGH